MALSFVPGLSQVVGTASQLSGAVVDPATATQGGTGLTSLAAGFIAMGSGGTPATAIPYGQRLIAYASALSFAASGDQTLTMTSTTGTYIIRRVTLGPNINALATVVLVGLLRTASGGAGSAITGAFVVTGLSATTAYLDQAITLASAVVPNPQLYVNITTAAANSSTAIAVYGDLVLV